MRVIALLSWYAEANPWLAATVASCAKFCDHVVAVDGAYGLFPEGRNRSGTEQHAIIQDAACASGMGVTIHTPKEKWLGNEVEKRTALFRLGEAVATAHEDWYFVVDADEVILEAPGDVRQRLEDTELDVAEVTLVNREDIEASAETAVAARQFVYPPDTAAPLRALFRAIPGLAPYGNHYTYKTPDGRTLWGNPSAGKQEPSLDLQDVVLEHRTNFRTKHRDEARRSYYGARDNAGIERNVCFHCKTPDATLGSWTAWRPDPDGPPGSLTGQRIPVCEKCAPIAKQHSDEQIRKLGGDPEAMIHRGIVKVPA